MPRKPRSGRKPKPTKRRSPVLYVRKVGAKNTFVKATGSTPAHKTRYRRVGTGGAGTRYIPVKGRKKPARKRR